MSWYKTGTVNVTKNSNIVTGEGTKWTNQLSGVSAGRMLILQTSKQIEIYEIESVQSDTQLTLSDNYSGETIKGLKYTIPTSPSVSIEQFALEIASSLAYHQKQLDGWQKILTGSGDVTLTAPDGQNVTIKSQKSLSSAIDNAVKKSGDTMTGQLILSELGIKHRYTDSENLIVLRTLGDNYSCMFYDAEKKQWLSKLVYNSTTNSWNFPSIDDVKINNKSVLKTADYGVGSFVGAPLSNQNDLLEGGCYATRTTEFPELTEFKNRDDSASLVVFPATTKNWCVEMLAVVNSILPRIFFRCATKNGKQQLYEAITTANINKYVIPIGDFRLMPFRANELPFGWYFRNGDNYLLSSAQGQVLNRLSNNYKRDHQITIKTINGQQYINVPSAFAPDGRGFFERAVNGTTRQVGSVEDDAIRDIWGHFDTGVVANHNEYARGAFCGTNAIYPKNGGFQPIKEWDAWGFEFYASRVVPTANENRPINMGMTPAIYLGV